MDSASAKSGFKQDLPPSGGYHPINWKRIPAKTFFNGYQMLAGFTIMTTVGFYLYSLQIKKLRRELLEVNDATLAIEPLLLAERDRLLLKEVRRHRDAEAELMKNVPGWEVGTLYGEPIYKTLPKDTWVEPLPREHYVHTKPNQIDTDRQIHFNQ